MLAGSGSARPNKTTAALARAPVAKLSGRGGITGHGMAGAADPAGLATPPREAPGNPAEYW
jgi:hypothetical protein